MVTAAYPFMEVRIDTSALMPVAERFPGVIAVVGKAPAKLITASKPRDDAGNEVDTAEFNDLFAKVTKETPFNTPIRIDTLDDIKQFTERTVTFKQEQGKWVVDEITVNKETPLSESLTLAMQQDPKPFKIYGVRVEGDKYAEGLAGLEAADDVTFVSLANERDVGAAATPSALPTNLMALKDHVEKMSGDGQKRLGVAMIDPTVLKSTDYVTARATAVNGLKSDTSRMVMIAARGATADAATAAMAAMAGYAPHISMVLKQVRGFKMPLEQQYSPAEIKALSEANIIPIIDPDLIVGEGLYFAEGRCFTTDSEKLYIDLVRTLDDIEFKLKAELIGLIGDARITKMGMTRLKTRVEGVLGGLKGGGVIDNYAIDIPVLNVLSLPESAWSPADRRLVETSRANRLVEFQVDITYGPAVHRLKVTLVPKF
jgi:hypothetical protein